MGDYSIRGDFEARCPAADVMRWLDTPAGIAGWWSDRVEGSADSVGDEFEVRFPTTPVVFGLAVTARASHVAEWHVAENPPWWKGTTIRFELNDRSDGSTTIGFSHRGFETDAPILAAITPAWVRFVDNLVAVSESGVANPAVMN